MELSEYRTFGISNCRNIELSEYRSVGLPKRKKNEIGFRNVEVSLFRHFSVPIYFGITNCPEYRSVEISNGPQIIAFEFLKIVAFSFITKHSVRIFEVIIYISNNISDGGKIGKYHILYTRDFDTSPQASMYSPGAGRSFASITALNANNDDCDDTDSDDGTDNDELVERDNNEEDGTSSD